MNTAYVVTSGEYSDYHIVCVCSDAESARIVADRINATPGRYESAYIEEYPVNDIADKYSQGHTVWGIRMSKKGVAIDIEEKSPEYMHYGLWDVNSNLYMSVWAKDSTHAVKIVNERRTEILATDRWGDHRVFTE